MRVAQKVETIREDLGSYGTVIADQVEEAMLGRGYAMLDIEPGRDQGRARAQDAQVRAGLGEADPATCWSSTGRPSGNCGCRRRTSARSSRSAWRWPSSRRLFPVHSIQPASRSSRLPAFKGSWAACAEGLEHPHTKEIRPITFDHAVPRAGTTWCWST